MSAAPSASGTVSKNATVLFVGTVVRMAFSFGFTIFVARLLGVADFGRYALVDRYFEFFLSLSATGLGILVAREIAREPESAGPFLSAATVLLLLITGSVTILLGAATAASGYAPETKRALWMVGIALFPAALAAMLEFAFVGFEIPEHVTYGAVLENTVRVGLGTVALLAGYGLVGLFLAVVISRTLTVGYYLVALRWHLPGTRWHTDWSSVRRVAMAWRVFAAENWLSNLYGSLGIIVLSFVWGERAVGPYAAAQKVLRMGVVAAQSYTKAIYPYLSRVFLQDPRELARLSRVSMMYMAAMVLPFVITVGLLADRIVAALFTDVFAESVPILRILVWVLLFDFFNPFLSHTLFARELQRRSLGVAAAKLTVLALAISVLVPAWSGQGLAWAKLLSAVGAFALYLIATVPGPDIARTLRALARPAVAGAALAYVCHLLREAGVAAQLAVGGATYVLILASLGLFSARTLEAPIGGSAPGGADGGASLERRLSPPADAK